MKQLKWAAPLAALALMAGASPAAASVTVGNTAPAGTIVNCSPNFDQVMQSTSGNSYAVPSTGGIVSWTIKSWSTLANLNPGSLALKAFRQVSGLQYQAVVHDGPRTLAVSSLNTFTAAPNLVVKAGDLIGLHNIDNTVGCATSSFSGVRLFFNGDLADGQSATFGSSGANGINVSAVLDPTNTFTQGATTLNKKKGTATVAFDVSNPGTLTATGTGVSASSAGAHSSVTVGAPGAASLEIRASGKKKKKLRSKGKVTLSPTVTFTPNGGTAKSLATSVKLKIKKK